MTDRAINARAEALILVAQWRDQSRVLRSEIDLALATYGDHGPLISGCVRDHFPDATKDHLRQLARQATATLDAAFAAWRRGRLRAHTLRRIVWER